MQNVTIARNKFAVVPWTAALAMMCVAATGRSAETASAAPKISFSREIRPILSENCFSCHGPDEKGRKAGLRLDLEATAKAENDGAIAVVPGRPELSTLLQRIETSDPDEVMPPPKAHKTVTKEQRTLLKQWILQGAVWGNHWSYETVQRPQVPGNGEKNAIDAFLKARLIKEKLSFTSEADRSTLVRRVALDATGLPPTLEELKSLSEKSPEEVVTYFLNQPGYGEHWAREWLDLARYADSGGYPSDPGRVIWAYRDWVIRALNANMTFDQFTIEQIAGDLLPHPTEDQRIATAFHRNTMTNNEGGTNDEEFRNAAVIDRVNTTFAVWMGTTMACAQCHTHKYDPITIGEYYQSYAFFNQSADADKRDDAPLLKIQSAQAQGHEEKRAREKAAIEAQFQSPKPEWLAGLEAWTASKPVLKEKKLRAIQAALQLPKEKRSAAQVQALEQYYVRNISPETKPLREQAGNLDAQQAANKAVTVPVMVELDAAKRRKTHVQLRGNWQALGDEVNAGVPSAFNPLKPDMPHNRLGLARWLVSRENPLTARVVVNRMWESLFGVGIVRSSEEFGSQGDLPEHPELLDWLATEFMESGWNVKRTLHLMMTSRAYRQDSASNPALNERDPDNRLLARGPRFRPSGEMLRDQALAVSGMLSSKMFGPPVRPLRPSLGLAAAFGGKGGSDWETSPGEDRHRRSIYTEVRRSSPYPSFATFDAPNRETCTIRRGRSNTPLQAFVTLNDPVFVETHQALARRILAEGGTSGTSRVQFAFKVCLSREPDAVETATLAEVYKQALVLYRSDAKLAASMATDPIGQAPKGLDLSELAAWTTVAGVVMNLDEFQMRR
jgi:mono/diheme cytochrome c family protein